MLLDIFSAQEKTLFDVVAIEAHLFLIFPKVKVHKTHKFLNNGWSNE